MPNVRIYNAKPTATRTNSVPTIRVSSFQTTRSGENRTLITAGTPIGLLLALTYASDLYGGQAFYGDSRPNVRIK